MPLVGVTGMSAERVSFLGRPGCIGYFTEVPSIKAATAAGTVRRESGREPAVIVGKYEVAGFTVPSGEAVTKRDDGGRPKLIIEKEFGTLRLEGDTSNIVVRKPSADLVERALPLFTRRARAGRSQDGCRQQAGQSPTRSCRSRPASFSSCNRGRWSQNRRGEFLIQKKIRFPAEP